MVLDVVMVNGYGLLLSYPTMNTFINFETYIPLTDFETVTNIKCENRRELSSLTKSEKP